MTPLRSADELANVSNSAWPSLRDAIERSPSTQALPGDRQRGLASLYALQVTQASTLGAMALNTGGVVVDHGWVRILGSGTVELPGLAQINSLGDPENVTAPPPFLIVGFDILGGKFAIDGGGLGVNPGEVCYWGPDTLRWEGLDVGHSGFVHSFISGASAEFYASMRWPGWEHEASEVSLDRGLSLYPPPFTTEGADLSLVSRCAVPFAELTYFYDEAAAQL